MSEDDLPRISRRSCPQNSTVMAGEAFRPFTTVGATQDQVIALHMVGVPVPFKVATTLQARRGAVYVLECFEEAQTVVLLFCPGIRGVLQLGKRLCRTSMGTSSKGARR